jgi:hypothetical protein
MFCLAHTLRRRLACCSRLRCAELRGLHSRTETADGIPGFFCLLCLLPFSMVLLKLRGELH